MYVRIQILPFYTISCIAFKLSFVLNPKNVLTFHKYCSLQINSICWGCLHIFHWHWWKVMSYCHFEAELLTHSPVLQILKVHWTNKVSCWSYSILCQFAVVHIIIACFPNIHLSTTYYQYLIQVWLISIKFLKCWSIYCFFCSRYVFTVHQFLWVTHISSTTSVVQIMTFFSHY